MAKYKNVSDLLFRILFSSIFLGLGGEHVFSDELIQKLMPVWMPWPRFISMFCGMILISGGSCIALGWQVQRASTLLGGFVIVVTILVHGPALMMEPAGLPQEWNWLWVVLQRSNFVKNLCLLGVCFHLQNYTPGKYSLDAYLGNR